MRIDLIVYSPQDDKNKQITNTRVNELHIKMIVEYIKSLSCPKEQKVALVDALLEKIKRQSNE